jgi:hypothetical protein
MKSRKAADSDDYIAIARQKKSQKITARTQQSFPPLPHNLTTPAKPRANLSSAIASSMKPAPQLQSSQGRHRLSRQ